ncbi:DUF1684 domain-containing protein [Neotabrizicola sp. sgz301269]|uniref:DUF1684 domain-containing protein n=1 Tax=Neotabrizicola sp. sgz301269 TaxID=3276282 RepID=UPI00376FC3A0
MQSLPDFRAARLAALTAEDGWLNLTDRIDLAPGTYQVGAAQEVRLSSGPDLLGTLTIAPDLSATFTLPDGRPQPFTPIPDVFPQLRADPFLLDLHTVDGIPALRVRDLRLPRQITLSHFPDSPDWVIRATWETLAPQAAQVPMVDGSFAPVTLTHRARFSHAGREITLTPTHWKSGKPMFVFRDATAGETYPACRFLVAEDITDTAITLDFNRAISPPCAFTDLAVCPLPPPGNILPFRIEAGEKAPPRGP